MSTRGYTLPATTELSEFTHDTSAGVRNAFYSIADTPILATYVHTGIGDTLAFPTSICSVRAIDVCTEVDTDRVLFFTDLSRCTLYPDTRG